MCPGPKYRAPRRSSCEAVAITAPTRVAHSTSGVKRHPLPAGSPTISRPLTRYHNRSFNPKSPDLSSPRSWRLPRRQTNHELLPPQKTRQAELTSLVAAAEEANKSRATSTPNHSTSRAHHARGRRRGGKAALACPPVRRASSPQPQLTPQQLAVHCKNKRSGAGWVWLD